MCKNNQNSKAYSETYYLTVRRLYVGIALVFMKTIINYCVCGIAVLTFTSCSHSLTEKQKAAITSIGVADHDVLKGAKKAVNGSKPLGVAQAITGASGGGILPALFGEAIDAGVVAVQKNSFQKQYGSDVERLNAIAYPKLVDAIEKRGVSVLQRDAFFGPKWTDKAGEHYFDGEITSYGLQRRHRDADETYLEAMVGVNVWLVSNDKKLFKAPLMLRSENAYTVADYVEQPERLRAVFKEACDGFDSQFSALLDQKLGRE